MKKILSLGIIRGISVGLAGVGIGMGITMLARLALGLPAWNQGQVYTGGILTGGDCLSYRAGCFWLLVALGDRQTTQRGTIPAPKIVDALF